MTAAPDQPRGAAGPGPSAQDEAALRAELEELSQRAIDAMEDQEPIGWRAGVGVTVGALLLFVGTILAGTIVVPGESGARGGVRSAVAALVLLAVGSRLVRPAVRPMVAGWREALRLRRRIVQIRSLLPAGTAGPGLYRRFIDRRFGHPAIAVLVAIPLFLLLVLPVILRRF